MAAELNILSPSITLFDVGSTLDPAPGEVSAGQGSKAWDYSVDDYVTVSQAGFVGSYYRLVRIPCQALVKQVLISTDAILDTNAAPTLTIDIGIAFSDSVYDGTNPALAGQVPQNTNVGNVTPFSAYVTPNKLFGTISAANLHTVLSNLNVTFAGTGAQYPLINLVNTPLWNLFGFTSDPWRNLPLQPGGAFDIYAYVSAAAATAGTGHLYCRCDFVV